MVDFSIVVPVYNRLENLKRTLTSLRFQKSIDPERYEIIVADDGSTDGTEDYIESLIPINKPQQPDINYVWCGPHQGFRPHRTRNIGVTHAKGKWIIFVDSDVVLNPLALSEHVKVREVHPDIVIIGMYHQTGESAKNILADDIKRNFDEAVMSHVPSSISGGPPQPGMDARISGFHATFEADKLITEYDGLGFWGGNVSWPVDEFWKIGGYDEYMPSGMGEDAELGQRMRLNKIPVLQYAPVYGVHIWHDRDWDESKRLVNKSIYYIDKKYGIGQFAGTTDPKTDPRDMSYDLWYQKEQGGTLVIIPGYPTVYALSADDYYVGIPTPDWIFRLGYTPADIVPVDEVYLAIRKNAGVIKKWEI